MRRLVPRSVRRLIRRFPLIIVDELQDTGYLSRQKHSAINPDPARGVLVGDPDQAIYEFNGARPDLFNLFELVEGAVTLPLSNSLRCAPSIAAVASHLKDSGGTIGPAHGKTGRAFLVRYGDMFADISRIVDAVMAAHKGVSIKVIARQTSTIVALIGRSAKIVPKLGCPSLNHMQRAVVASRGALAECHDCSLHVVQRRAISELPWHSAPRQALPPWRSARTTFMEAHLCAVVTASTTPGRYPQSYHCSAP